MQRLVYVPFVFVLLAACATEKGAARDDVPPSSEEAAPEVPGVTEKEDVENAVPDPQALITEKEFQDLHELKHEAVAFDGEEIALDGSAAYLALPAGVEAPVPGVIVVHEWWGLNEHIRHYADRIAAQGYAALAVDLYGGEVAETPEAAMKLMKSVDEARSLEILEAAQRFLTEDERVQAPRTAVIGWCFGGTWSLKTAQHVEGVDAAVIYYGKVPTDPQVLQGLPPILAVFGTEDPSIPVATVDAFEGALGEAGVTHRVLRYEANHAFANPSSARYDAPAAADAWREVRGFLAEHLR